MQVSSIKELDTHAVIGGGFAQNFGMSDSAEFFTVLSDTLYRDKKLAVVREVICNAWDAHIDASKQDVPIEITLTDYDLTIRDFGKGIAKDKIGPVYCVYGASTKASDGAQTGGFGLGCKAPFAYSNHFTVTSCHNGTRTLWAISRGGIESDGKPSFREMVSTKTEETGIAVSVPIETQNDSREFHQLILKVVKLGGINAELNGQRLDTYDYTEARKTGFCVMPQGFSLNESRCYVLYGAVTYPVRDTDPKTKRLLSELRNFISSGVVMLIAKPHTIGVTPSREALSYSELTNATINKLLEKTLNSVRGAAQRIYRKTITDRIDKMINSAPDLPAIALKNWHSMSENRSDNTLCASPDQIAIRYVLRTAGNYRQEKFFNTLAARIAKKFPRYSGIRRLPPHVCSGCRVESEISKLMAREDMKIAYRIASSADAVGSCRFFFGGRSSVNRDSYAIEERKGHGPIQNTILIAPSRKAIFEAIHQATEKYASTSGYRNEYAYREMPWIGFVLRSPSAAQIAKIKETAATFGIEVVTLAFPARRKPRKKLESDCAYYDIAKLTPTKSRGRWAATEPTIKEPRFYFRALGTIDNLNVTRVAGSYSITDKNTLKKIAKHFPDTAVVWTNKQECEVKKKGAVHIFDAMAAKFGELLHDKFVQYEALRSEKAFCDLHIYPWDYPNADLALTLAAQSKALSLILFPSKARKNDSNLGAVNDILAIANAFHLQSADCDFSKKRKQLFSEAKASFEHILGSPEELNKRFSFLASIKEFSAVGKNEEAIALVIKTLMRKHKAQKETM